MFEGNEINEPEFCLESISSLPEFEIEEELSAWDLFSMEIDAWARHASAANGFGDY